MLITGIHPFDDENDNKIINLLKTGNMIKIIKN